MTKINLDFYSKLNSLASFSIFKLINDKNNFVIFCVKFA